MKYWHFAMGAAAAAAHCLYHPKVPWVIWAFSAFHLKHKNDGNICCTVWNKKTISKQHATQGCFFWFKKTHTILKIDLFVLVIFSDFEKRQLFPTVEASAPCWLSPQQALLAVCVSEWRVSSLCCLEMKREGGRLEGGVGWGVFKGHWEVCVGVGGGNKGGYDCVSRTRRDTSRTSLGGGGKENGGYVSCKKQSVTHTPTSIPVTPPVLSLELTGKKRGDKRRKEGRKGWGEWWRLGGVERSEQKQRRDSKTERTGNHSRVKDEAEWSIPPCHPPHTVNGWPLQSPPPSDLSLLSQKWIKRASGRMGRRGESGREKGVSLPQKQLVIICWLSKDKYDRTKWLCRHRGSHFANAVKCRYKSLTGIRLIWGFQAPQQLQPPPPRLPPHQAKCLLAPEKSLLVPQRRPRHQRLTLEKQV